MAEPELITIGQLVKPQGLKGEMVVKPLSDHPGRFEGLKSAFLRTTPTPRKVTVEWSWPHKGRFVLKLAGIDSIEAAEPLRGLDLALPETELAALPAGSYYHHQLKGLRVIASDGGSVGAVADLIETGSTVVLVVRAPGREVLIPLADAFVHEVDLEAGCLRVTLPETTDAKG